MGGVLEKDGEHTSKVSSESGQAPRRNRQWPLRTEAGHVRIQRRQSCRAEWREKVVPTPRGTGQGRQPRQDLGGHLPQASACRAKADRHRERQPLRRNDLTRKSFGQVENNWSAEVSSERLPGLADDDQNVNSIAIAQAQRLEVFFRYTHFVVGSELPRTHQRKSYLHLSQ